MAVVTNRVCTTVGCAQSCAHLRSLGLHSGQKGIGSKVGDKRAMTSKLVVLQVPITELPTYVGGAKIKLDGHKRQTRTDIITH